MERPPQIFLEERKFQASIVFWVEAGRTYF
jgi:hypothetical protein